MSGQRRLDGAREARYPRALAVDSAEPARPDTAGGTEIA
jgi:hypothetical protein